MPPHKLANLWERRSKNEINFESHLQYVDCTWEYEPETVNIFPQFQGTNGVVAPITYTPDYKLTFPNGKVLWVEVKGYARDEDWLKFKLADYHFRRKGQAYVMVGHFGSKKTDTEQYYLYHMKATVNKKRNAINNKVFIPTASEYRDPRTYKVPTFWEWLEKWVNE